MNELLAKEFDSDSNDEDYVPSEKEEDAEDGKDKLSNQKTKAEEDECKKKVNEMWEKMQNKAKAPTQKTPPVEEKDEKTEDQKLEDQIKEALKKAKEQKKKTVKNTYYFAGQKFEDSKEVNEKELEKMKKKETHSSLDLLIDTITKKKNISTMEKSKKDWRNYVEEQKIEKELMINRKDGYLGKKHFIENSNAVVMEQNRIMVKKAKFAYETKMNNK